MNGTVKQFLETLEQMRKIYPFEDSETRLTTYNIYSDCNNNLQLFTVDKESGISVILQKDIQSEFKVAKE